MEFKAELYLEIPIHCFPNYFSNPELLEHSPLLWMNNGLESNKRPPN